MEGMGKEERTRVSRGRGRKGEGREGREREKGREGIGEGEGRDGESGSPTNYFRLKSFTAVQSEAGKLLCSKTETLQQH